MERNLDSNNFNNILPQSILNIIQDYVGERISIDINLYDLFVSCLAERIERIYNRNLDIEDTFNLINEYNSLELILDVVRYISFDGGNSFWFKLYMILPVSWDNKFLAKYSHLVVESKRVNENIEVDINLEVHKYKIDRLQKAEEELNKLYENMFKDFNNEE